MKKHLSIFLALALAVTCFALAACGGKSGSAPSPDSKYVGVWKASYGEYAGEKTPIEEILDGKTYILDLKADGTCVVTTDVEAKGTWTENEDGVHVKAGETNADFFEQDNALVFEIFGAKIWFEKQ